jgi:hypothetical protein
MPSKLAIAFLEMVVGGSAFTFAGLTTFLTVNQLQDRQIQTRTYLKIARHRGRAINIG